MDLIPLGAITDSVNAADFDVTTFAGALEELFARANEYFGDETQIGYIINYATPMSEWGGATKDMSEYVAIATQVCENKGAGPNPALATILKPRRRRGFPFGEAGMERSVHTPWPHDDSATPRQGIA